MPKSSESSRSRSSSSSRSSSFSRSSFSSSRSGSYSSSSTSSRSGSPVRKKASSPATRRRSPERRRISPRRRSQPVRGAGRRTEPERRRTPRRGSPDKRLPDRRRSPPRRDRRDLRGRSASPNGGKNSRSKSPDKNRSEASLEKQFELCLSGLSRSITKGHIQEIFEHFGKINKIEHSIDRRTNLPMESCYLYFAEKADAEKAVEYMDKGQLDGMEIRLQFTLKPNHGRQGSPRRARGGLGGGRKWGTNNNNRQRSPPRGGNYNNRGPRADSPVHSRGTRAESPLHSRKRNNSRSNSPSPKRVKATEG